ncbi:hypothetical protein BaRGS_00002848 [Batillaria attramentaria]|uniref:Uncharacterized protein n=1 Tax=Batillaria attramentaria TaxID=370345 RepID=A0ABD0M2Z3_9CAEN
MASPKISSPSTQSAINDLANPEISETLVSELRCLWREKQVTQSRVPWHFSCADQHKNRHQAVVRFAVEFACPPIHLDSRWPPCRFCKFQAEAVRDYKTSGPPRATFARRRSPETGQNKQHKNFQDVVM